MQQQHPQPPDAEAMVVPLAGGAVLVGAFGAAHTHNWRPIAPADMAAAVALYLHHPRKADA